ncbi:MAG: ABC transporter permease [bacterium]
MALAAVRAIVRKDLLVFFTDRRAVIMSFAAPVAIASFFGFLFGNNRTQEAARVPVRIVDQDQSPISKAIAKGLSGDKTLDVQTGTVDEAREAVRKGKTTVAVVVPPHFGAAAGQALFGEAAKPQLDLLYDPSHAMELAMVRGILTQHVMQAVSAEMLGGEQGRAFNQQALESLKTTKDMPETDRKTLSEMLTAVDRWYSRPVAPGSSPAAGGLVLPVPDQVSEQAVTARKGVEYNSFAHSFAGMGVQFLLFACIDLAIGMLLERQLGLWKRIRAAPLSRFVLLGAKATSGALIALMTLGVSFAFGMIVFGIRIQGSVLGFMAVCISTALMASCFGLLIASLGKTPQATRGVAILAVLLMVMLGGAWVPSFIFPAWLQKVTLAIPARWAVDGLDATTWRGVGLLGILPTVGALLGFAAFFGALAVARFRWDAE